MPFVRPTLSSLYKPATVSIDPSLIFPTNHLPAPDLLFPDTVGSPPVIDTSSKYELLNLNHAFSDVIPTSLSVNNILNVTFSPAFAAIPFSNDTVGYLPLVFCVVACVAAVVCAVVCAVVTTVPPAPTFMPPAVDVFIGKLN